MVGVFCILAARLLWLQVFDARNLSEAAAARRTSDIVLGAKRGTIYDRNGNVLAMSIECKTIYCNPKDVHDPTGIATVLAKNLGGTAADYLPKLTQDTTFIYIQHKVENEIAGKIMDELKEADLTGIYTLADTKRIYPYGDVCGQILGLLNIDGVAQSGIELMYDDILRGTDGSMIMERGLGGTPIAGGAYEIVEPQDGADIMLTVDVELQRKVEETLSPLVELYEAESAAAIVMDPRTGEILAAAAPPLPTITDRSTLDPNSLSMNFVSSSFEPGSVLKALTVAIGIENGSFDADTTYYVQPSTKVGDHYVFDVDDRDYDMVMSVREILRRSSNAGAAMLVQDSIGAEAFAAGLESFGIGHETGIDYPGEVTGIVKSLEEYDGSTAGSMAYGQGVSVPAIEIVSAYAAIANDGVRVTPHFLLKADGQNAQWPQGRRVVSPETAHAVTDMMRTVVNEGTGKGAAPEGVDVAGKTGTADQVIVGEEGYAASDLVSSFCGFAQASDPSLLIYVGFNHTYYHSEIAADAFRTIMVDAMNTVGIVPEGTEEI